MKGTALLGRVVIGTLLAGAVFFIVTFGPLPVLALVVAVWSVVATLEFARLLRIAGIEINPWLIAASNISVVAAAWLGWLPEFLLAPLAVVLIAAVALREPRPRIPVYGVFTIVYLGFLPAHLVMLKAMQVSRPHDYVSPPLFSPWLVVFPLLLTWVNDTAAWGLGRLFGRRKLAPVVSPNKTWEGFVAGLVFSSALAALFLSRFPAFSGRPWALLAAFGIGLGALAQVGDLFESIFKRAVGLKDSSGVLGEHGGFLDRMDSLLFVIPAWYYLLRLYLP